MPMTDTNRAGVNCILLSMLFLILQIKERRVKFVLLPAIVYDIRQ